jgi:hypothetical protein
VTDDDDRARQLTKASIWLSRAAFIPTVCGNTAGKPCAFVKVKVKRQKAMIIAVCRSVF